MASGIIVAWAGIRKALKDLAGDGKPGTANHNGPANGPGVQAIVGGTIMETTTLLMWSESNREVAEAAEAVKACIAANTKAIEHLPVEMDARMESLINAMNYNTEAVRSMCREFSETRHEIVRLRDSMERRT